MTGTIRKEIKIGLNVSVIKNQDQITGKLTKGVVSRILTSSPKHPHGIKVMLESAIAGRVKAIEIDG